MKKFLNLKNKKRSSVSGFTLIETLATIFVFTLIMIGVTLLMKNILTTSEQQYGVLNNVNQAEWISKAFVEEIRNGTYGVDGSYPINQAGTNQIIFFSTAPLKNGTISKIRYYISGNTLYRGITNPGGSPLSYIGQTETITTLSTAMSMGSTPLFYYYDGNYNGSGNPLTQPVNINTIRFVKINLIVLKELTQNSSNTFTVVAGASMRNLKTNLGN